MVLHCTQVKRDVFSSVKLTLVKYDMKINYFYYEVPILLKRSAELVGVKFPAF